MIILGVTGSIGSGKSHFCKVLTRQPGVEIISSDAEVHKLYSGDQLLIPHIKKHFPSAVKDNTINRQILGDIVFKDHEKRKLLENIVHPILAQKRNEFLKSIFKHRPKLVLFDIPLLFEMGLENECDYIVTLYCSPAVQRKRVMRRKGMTAEKYERIIATQMCAAEKIKYSDFYLNTGRSKEFITRAAKKLYSDLVY